LRERKRMATAKTLADRLKEAVKQNKGSLNPDPPAPPEPQEEIPDIREFDLPPATRMQLVRLTEEHRVLGDEESTIKKSRNALTAKIKTILGEYKVGKAMVGDLRVSYYNVPRTSLSKIKLMEAGVTLKQIAAAEETKDAYTLKISRKGEEEE
jgi:hypothetical protein